LREKYKEGSRDTGFKSVVEERRLDYTSQREVRIWDLKGTVLVIAEKPKAGRKIAEALAKGSFRKYGDGVPYYVIDNGSSKIVIASAAGHLYELYTGIRGYPVFEYEWRPLYEVDKDAKHTYRFLNLLRELCRKADYYVNACDYDIEGSVIGYLIILFNGDPKRSFRAKFSSLTPVELSRAFNKLTGLDWEMIEAGLCRHELDWIWGINISRALMDAVKKATGRNLVLSAGRVQTPTLKKVVDVEIERNMFIPLPQYVLTASIVKDGRVVKLQYDGPVIEEKRVAYEILSLLKRKPLFIVEKYDVKTIEYHPPPAFNLGDLQSEAARIYGFSPYKTQVIAEKLYLEALISYPRTNSQKLPPTIDFKGIMNGLKQNPRYSKLIDELLFETKGRLQPVQGEKDDPAHPAIYPTGLKPESLKEDEWKIYDLITRRFLAAFAERAVVERRLVVLKHVEDNRIVFHGSGQQIVKRGWIKYYPFIDLGETYLPVFKPGERIVVDKIDLRKTYTKPPERISKIKLLKWMESVEIGTESTRARIIETLFKRKYLVSNKGYAEPTELGYGLIEVLTNYFPEITSVDLTRYFENEMEKIKLGLKKRVDVVNEAKNTLSNLLVKFEERKDELGVFLSYRLGLLKPGKKCMLCNREVYMGELCKYHSEALEKVKSYYEEWRRREGVSWSEYIASLKKMRSTGKWVKQVLDYIEKHY